MRISGLCLRLKNIYGASKCMPWVLKGSFVRGGRERCRSSYVETGDQQPKSKFDRPVVIEVGGLEKPIW
jgi:hypothetical protein